MPIVLSLSLALFTSWLQGYTRGVRDIVYRHPHLASLADLLRQHDQSLPLGDGEVWADGEWVLAIFEVGRRGRATAAVGNASVSANGTFVAFDRRDWERIHDFASTHPDDSLSAIVAVAPARPTADSLRPAGERVHESLFDVSVQDAAILVVSDDPEMMLALQQCLLPHGTRVDGAATGEAAVVELRSRRYEVVVVCHDLAGVTGLELCKLLRNDEALDALPVIFVSSTEDVRLATEAVSVGADEQMGSPVRATELAARCLALVRRYRYVQRQLGNDP